MKSAILDQLIRDLRSQATLTTPHSFYAKSDSGLYGKYQKVDTPDVAILDAIRSALQVMVDEGVAAERARLAAEAGASIDKGDGA